MKSEFDPILTPVLLGFDVKTSGGIEQTSESSGEGGDDPFGDL